MALAPISATVIDAMLAAGATCEQLATIARQHFPELAQTVDALMSIGSEAALIATMLKAHAADREAAARDHARREAQNQRQRKCRAKKKGKRVEVGDVAEPELPLCHVTTRDTRDSRDTCDPPSLKEKSPPTPPSKENNPSPISEPNGSDAIPSTHEVVVLNEDPKARLFREGRTILTSFGIAPKQHGSLIGLWLKRRPDPVGVLAAIRFARDQNVAEPVAYISAIMNGHKANDSTYRARTHPTAGRDAARRDPTVTGVARYAAKQGLV
jgi:hypothetical protein